MYLSVYRTTSYFYLLCFYAPPLTDLYTLSLHDALPISSRCVCRAMRAMVWANTPMRSDIPDSPATVDAVARTSSPTARSRSEEHTSELQSHHDLVCRLLLEKKNPRTRCWPDIQRLCLYP